MTSLLVLVGSLREQSLNKRLANVAIANVNHGVQTSFFYLSTLPLYNGDHDGETAPSQFAPAAPPSTRPTGYSSSHPNTTTPFRGW